MMKALTAGWKTAALITSVFVATVLTFWLRGSIYYGVSYGCTEEAYEKSTRQHPDCNYEEFWTTRGSNVFSQLLIPNLVVAAVSGFFLPLTICTQLRRDERSFAGAMALPLVALAIANTVLTLCQLPFVAFIALPVLTIGRPKWIGLAWLWNLCAAAYVLILMAALWGLFGD